MKTNQIMKVQFSEGTLDVSHLDMMGNLNQVFQLGNVYRMKAGNSSLRMESWLAMESTKEYIAVVTEAIGRPAKITTRGKTGTTKVHLRILLDAAMYLDAKFKDEVIKTFVEQRLLRVRDDSGDGFIDLNARLALTAEEVLGKQAHAGHFIQLAKAIRAKLLPPEHLGWNYATSEQLNARYDLEVKLNDMLRLGLVRDWEHLKEIIERL